MNIGAMDKLNIVVGLVTVISTFSGMLSILYAITIVILILAWLAYHKIPWAHKGWRSETVLESVKPFYSFSRVLHSVIAYSLVTLITFSLLIGFATKSGPSVIAKDAAEYVWNNNAWSAKTIKSSTIPPELSKSKKEDQPYAVIVDKAVMKAAPLSETLTAIAEKYSGIYAQLGGVLFLFVFVTGIVLYPTEMLAEARIKKEESH